MPRLNERAAFVLFAAILLNPLPAFAQDDVIRIKNFMFMPMEIQISAGSTVTWKNMDEEPHTITSDTGLFRSGGIDGGEQFSFKFEKPGVYKYVCSIHPQMVGKVVVK